MNTLTKLTISDISIRQDEHGRYCLNDLHKAAGNESKHQPAKWLITQQAIEFIDLLKSEESITGIPVIFTKQGLGTFAVKKLVYSYAMWISAKFHLAVIRAYDALVTGQLLSNPLQLPEPKTKQALPGGLTLEMQDTIKALVKQRAEELPKEKQAGAIIKQWSAIKKKFGCTYKEIAPDNFVNILSLLSRLPIEGDLLDKEPDPFLTDHAYRVAAQEAYNTHWNKCHADMEAAGVKSPAWPKVDDKVITGLVASMMWRGCWIVSFGNDQRMQLSPMTDHDCVVDSCNPERIKSFINSLDLEMLHHVTDAIFARMNRQLAMHKK